MYKILVATDGTAQAGTTIDETIRIAVPLKAEVTVLSVMEDSDSMNYASSVPQDVMAKVQQDQEKFYARAVEQAKGRLQEKGLKTRSLVLKGDPVEVICATAEEEGCDLIILGRRRLGRLQSLLLGSVSNKVLMNAKTNVLIIKQ
jgi:nucleotide-binding universal stress UspA family protein